VKYILEIATLLIFALVLGCDLGDPRQGKEFGISRDPSGAIIFLFKPCRSFSVDDIRLVRVEGKRFGDEDDENVLWDVQAKPPVIVTSANTLRITTDAPPQDAGNSKLANSGKASCWTPEEGPTLRKSSLTLIPVICDRDFEGERPRRLAYHLSLV
jgi:hypothetical protein